MPHERQADPGVRERWTAQRKATIILEVLKGQISVPEAARKYGFMQGEYREWADEYHQADVEALKTKIGQLVMDDEIRQEAMRPFLSGDQTSSV